MMNHRVIVTRYGGPEVLKVIEEPLRTVGSQEVRVRVQSAGVALADIMRREGKYPKSPLPFFTPGYDVVGIVDEVGAQVEGYHQGDRVAAFFDGVGGYADYVYAQVEELVPVPVEVDAGAAVAAMLNYVTAYQMLYRIAEVEVGERILIHGASGGVGTALLELGRLAKLEMYGTASRSKHDVVAQFGAIPIDYMQEDFVEVLQQVTPGGVDVVFDPIGGANFERSLQTLSRQGRFVGYGYTSVLADGKPEDWVKDWTNLASRGTTDAGQPIHVYSITALRRERLDWFREDAGVVFTWLAAGRINPVISQRIPLHDAAYAQELLEKSQSVGKIVLIN
ncbi:medium chain dehydrogenase/reductase family protein [Paenibacillus terrigena]|uniref:medium chain dehydrogenase/reductase family protein n=1 Tax=Paenibacillus terrigena TaxID=369333 RepID=UPI00036F9F5C|nr:medium chain dehydrogenase/reductase family protein [Paenibacillus terrigena]